MVQAGIRWAMLICTWMATSVALAAQPWDGMETVPEYAFDCSASIFELPESIGSARESIAEESIVRESANDLIARGQTGDPWTASWGRIDIVLGWLNGERIVPLLASNPLGTSPETIGLPSNASTEILFGGDASGEIGDLLRVGGRGIVGRWLDSAHSRAIQAELFGLGSDGSGIDISSAGDPILSRPFFNTDTNAEDAQILALAGLAEGDYHFSASAEIWSAAATIRRRMRYGPDGRIDLLYGYRYLHFGETLRSQESLLPQNPAFAADTTLTLTDEFRAKNDFHGFDLGMNWTRRFGRFETEITSLVAFGQVRNRLQLTGSTRSFVPGIADETVDGGFMVSAEENGRGNSREFAILPQFRVDVGYRLFERLQFRLGYSFLYLNETIRPHEFLDNRLSGATLGATPSTTGTASYSLPDSSITLHALNLGLQFEF